MNEPITNPFDEDEKSGRQPIVWAILGIAAMGCGLLFAGAFFFFKPDAQSLYDRYFPSPTATSTLTPTPTATATPTQTITPTATVTSTPHVLITPMQDETVFHETFDTNERKWYSYFADGIVNVTEGRLLLRSPDRGYIAIALCTNCLALDEPFYMQAEVTTLENTGESYGLAFCSKGYGPDFYTFQMNPRTSQYSVYKHSANGWTTLINERDSLFINEFPISNILGLKYENGTMELYINGNKVTSYTDSNPFACRKSGFYVNDGKFDVVVDNVFAYPIESTVTPSP